MRPMGTIMDWKHTRFEDIFSGEIQLFILVPEKYSDKPILTVATLSGSRQI